MFDPKLEDFLQRLRQGEPNPSLVYEVCRIWEPLTATQLYEHLLKQHPPVDPKFMEVVVPGFQDWQSSHKTTFSDEYAFRAELARIIARHGYISHFHEGAQERKFNVQNARNGYVDLYVKTPEHWKHHEIMPVLGIETKLAEKGLGWLRQAIDQTCGYAEDEQAEYLIEGKRVPRPSLFLVATDHSIYGDHLYRWNPPSIKQPELTGVWIGLTELYDRLLWDRTLEANVAGAAVFRKGYFYSNKFGPNGGAPRYDIQARRIKSA